MRPIIEIDHLSKRYDSGTVALNDVSLNINEGEILALLGPNGAGKTTLISIICGLVVPTGGTVRVGGHDIRTDWRAARKMIGLVPQEILLEPFEKVIDCVRFTRGLYGEPPDEAYVEQLLRSLALWGNALMLGGGLRVLLAFGAQENPGFGEVLINAGVALLGARGMRRAYSEFANDPNGLWSHLKAAVRIILMRVKALFAKDVK